MSRILNLDDEEINWLESKIENFDVQFGCPVGCIVCAEDSPAYKGSMEWAKFMGIVEGIAEIRARRGVNFNLFPRNLGSDHYMTYPFKKSDPVYYHSMDGIRERNIHDVVHELFTALDCVSNLNTSGWKPGNNHMQRGVEAIVADINSGRIEVELNYSIKTVGSLIRREYLEFQEKAAAGQVISKGGSKKLSQEEFMQAFFGRSQYVKQLTNNLKTLAKSETGFSIQCVDRGLKRANGKYPEFALLFSYEFVAELFSYCIEKSKVEGIDVSEIRDLVGMGRAITSLGLKPIPEIREYSEILKDGINYRKKVHFPIESMSAAIDASGKLNLYLTDASMFYSPIIPHEFLLARSEYYKQKDKQLSEQYAMLANLQGRKLLR